MSTQQCRGGVSGRGVLMTLTAFAIAAWSSQAAAAPTAVRVPLRVTVEFSIYGD